MNNNAFSWVAAVSLLALSGCSGPSGAAPSAQSQASVGASPSSTSPDPSAPARSASEPGRVSFAGAECANVTSRIYCDDCGLDAQEVSRPEAEACLVSALLDPLTANEKASPHPDQMRDYRRSRAAHPLGEMATASAVKALEQAKAEKLPDAVARAVDDAQRRAKGRAR